MNTRNSSRGLTTEIEKEGLLNAQAESSHHDPESSAIREVQPLRWQETLMSRKLAFILLALNMSLLIICALLAAYIHTHLPHHRACSTSSQSYSNFDIASPASQAIELIWQDPWKINTEYSGAPGPDYSTMWSDLLDGTLLNVTKDEVEQSGERASVQYETGGYAAGLGVGHDLHCMKRLKDFVWLEELYPGIRRDESASYLSLRQHADHCVDVIRQQIQCHADILLYPLEYVEHSRVSGKPTVSRLSQRKCVNFDKLHDWMKSRSGNSDLFVKPEWL